MTRLVRPIVSSIFALLAAATICSRDCVYAGARSLDRLNPDGNRFPNWEEASRGRAPFLADSDGDGVSDSADAFPLDPTRSDAPAADPTDTTPPTITLTSPTNAVPVP